MSIGREALAWTPDSKSIPSFDHQINGLEGVDFSNGKLTVEQVLKVCRGLGKMGVQCFSQPS